MNDNDLLKQCLDSMEASMYSSLSDLLFFGDSLNACPLTYPSKPVTVEDIERDLKECVSKLNNAYSQSMPSDIKVVRALDSALQVKNQYFIPRSKKKRIQKKAKKLYTEITYKPNTNVYVIDSKFFQYADKPKRFLVAGPEVYDSIIKTLKTL